MQTIEQLRKSGYKVRVIHYRQSIINKKILPQRDIGGPLFLEAKGGKTRIELRSPEGIETFGEALCSDKDTYNRKLGNRIALGRAMNALNESNKKTFPLTFNGVDLIEAHSNPVMES